MSGPGEWGGAQLQALHHRRAWPQHPVEPLCSLLDPGGGREARQSRGHLPQPPQGVNSVKLNILRE